MIHMVLVLVIDGGAVARFAYVYVLYVGIWPTTDDLVSVIVRLPSSHGEQNTEKILL